MGISVLRSKFGLFGLIAVCVTGIAYLLSFDIAQARPYFGRTSDPTPVAISVADSNDIIHFLIPKNFLTFSENWSGGIQSGMTIEVRFPAMRPFDHSRPGGKIESDALIISLDSFIANGWKYEVSKVLIGKLKDQWVYISNVTDGKGRTYKRYVSYADTEKQKDPAALIKEFYVPEDENVYLECVRENSNPNVGCSGFANYGMNLSLRFQFRRTDFEKWPQMRAAAVNLLNSFRRDPNQRRERRQGQRRR